MVEWLDGFRGDAGELRADILTDAGRYTSTCMADLRERGLPDGGGKSRRPFDSRVDDWEPVPAARYLSAFGKMSPGGENHAVFRFAFGRCEYLVPALALLRGMFPLISEALEYAFTPRPLEALCIPLTRGGQWTVVMPNFTGLYKARFRRSTVEALTWASLFPSARRAWHSAYQAALQGRMCLDLPKATLRLVPYGVRVGNTVHVTRVTVNALLSHEDPFEFAHGASRSFVLMTNSEPLAPSPNAYYETPEANDAARYRLSDAEWDQVRHLCEQNLAPKGRSRRHSARDIADAMVIRAEAALRWSEVPVRIAPDALATHAQRWRADGTLQKLLTAVQEIRGTAADLLAPKAHRVT